MDHRVVRASEGKCCRNVLSRNDETLWQQFGECLSMTNRSPNRLLRLRLGVGWQLPRSDSCAENRHFRNMPSDMLETTLRNLPGRNGLGQVLCSFR